MSSCLALILSYCLGALSLDAEYGSVQLPLGLHGEMSAWHFYKFLEKSSKLVVIDQGTITPKYKNLDAAMRANACVAGINGGYFDADGKPLGLVIAGGRVTGKLNVKNGLTSATLYVENDKIFLVPTSVFATKKPPWPRQLIQSGPFIMEDSKINPSLQQDHYARRSIMGTDGKGMWFFAFTPPTSLPRLAAALSKANAIPGLQIRSILNLDGGNSSSFWCRRPNNALYFRESNALQTFIGIVPKD